LRTPITVITGALEILEQSDLSTADVEVLNRVRRATLDMKTTIEMFLCLARETDDGLYVEKFLVMPLVNQAIDQQRYMLNDKSVDIEIDLIDVEMDECSKPVANGHPQAFSIAVNNLVRNAFEHRLTGQGPITIRIDARELLVANQLSSTEQHSPTDASSHGYGLGLGIVERLCERNGWSFSLRADKQRVVARLSW
jgi:signal transduction histidine kinase